MLCCQARREQEQAQLEVLEMQLLMPDILLFRHLSARALKRSPSLQGIQGSFHSDGSGSALTGEVGKDVDSPKEGALKDSQPKEADSPPGSSSRCEAAVAVL